MRANALPCNAVQKFIEKLRTQTYRDIHSLPPPPYRARAKTSGKNPEAAPASYFQKKIPIQAKNDFQTDTESFESRKFPFTAENDVKAGTAIRKQTMMSAEFDIYHS